MQTLTCFAPSFLAPIVEKTFGFKMRISEQTVQALKREGNPSYWIPKRVLLPEMPSVGDCWIMTYNHLHFTDEKTASQRWTFSHGVTLVNEDQTYQIQHMGPCHQVAKAMAISSSLGTAWVLNKCLWNAWVSRWMRVILLTVTSTSVPAFPWSNECYFIQVCWEDWQIMSFLVRSSRTVSCWGPNSIPVVQSCPCPQTMTDRGSSHQGGLV